MAVNNVQYNNSEGKPYSEEFWLENHHAIKSRIRSELVAELPINDGDEVLDIGCGTGVWTFLIANKVGHKGSVVGLDLDKNALRLAQKRRQTHNLMSQISFLEIDTMSISENHQFDVVTLFNCLSYIKKPTKLLDKVSRLLKPKGLLIVKDSDLGTDFFWPVDRGLHHNIMSKIENAHALLDTNPYDSFFARKIPHLLTNSGFESISSAVQSYSFCYPLDKREQLYIAENGKMISNTLRYLEFEKEASEWEQQFDIESDRCIFHKKSFLYAMSEFLFYARTPSRP